MSENFDLGGGRGARDEGIGRVLANNELFRKQYSEAFELIPVGWIGMNEDIVRGWFGTKPGHPNAWGACWNAMKRKGRLVELPDIVSMAKRTSHARRTHLHQKVW